MRDDAFHIDLPGDAWTRQWSVVIHTLDPAVRDSLAKAAERAGLTAGNEGDRPEDVQRVLRLPGGEWLAVRILAEDQTLSVTRTERKRRR